MKNIGCFSTIETLETTNNLNIIMWCPHCESNEIIHGTKKWKCIECHKSFKKPKIIGNHTSAYKNKALVLPTNDDEVQTTPYFWDCECEDKFIHPKSVDMCLACGAASGNQPDSRVSEVVSAKLKGEI